VKTSLIVATLGVVISIPIGNLEAAKRERGSVHTLPEYRGFISKGC